LKSRNVFSRPVGEREQPAVAGQDRVVALAKVHPDLEPRARATLDAVVPPRGDPEWLRRIAAHAGLRREPRRGAVRRDHEPRADRRLAVVLVPDPSPGHPAVLLGRGDGLGPLHQAGAGLLGVARQELVELGPRHHQAEVRELP
jgi:hypothetical protein